MHWKTGIHVFRIINMFFRPVNTKSFVGNLEFPCGIPKAQERKHPDEESDSPGLNTFKTADIHSLAVVSQPVAKVDSLDHHARPFVTFNESNGFEHVLNIAMAPIAPFDLRDRSYKLLQPCLQDSEGCSYGCCLLQKPPRVMRTARGQRRVRDMF